MKKIVLAGAAFLLIVLALFPGCSGSDSSKLQDLQTQVQQQKEQIASLSSENQQLDSEISELKAESAKLTEEKDTLTTQVTGLYSTIAALDSSIQSLANAKDALDALLAQTQKELEVLKQTTPEDIATLSAQIASFITQISQLQADKDRLNLQVAILAKELTASPDHSLTWSQITNDPELKSAAWVGKDTQWHETVREIGIQYHSTHIYIPGETDCDDMAVDIWNMLLAQNIKSVIMIGNLENKNGIFSEANHAWLVVYNYEGKYAILEPTNGEVIYGINVDGTYNSKIDPYYSGWAYKKPSDLWQDIKKKW